MRAHRKRVTGCASLGSAIRFATARRTRPRGRTSWCCARRWGHFGALAETIAPHLHTDCIVTDVGSVKSAVVRDVSPHIPDGVHFIPGHPIAGTEQSGPDAGFAELFDGRWCILTPIGAAEDDVSHTADRAEVEKLARFWRACGSNVDFMDPHHHDLVLAITSHLPHLIAYNIVGTAADLETVTQSDVIKYSAGGFRDFTRIAASDPTMWRDIFLNNREAVLEMLGRFTEDLSALQRAIRWGDGDALFERFQPYPDHPPKHHRCGAGFSGAGFRPSRKAGRQEGLTSRACHRRCW